MINLKLNIIKLNMHYRIMSHLNILLCFDSDKILEIGDLVEVILRNKKCIGIVIELCYNSHNFALNDSQLLYSLGVNYALFIQKFSYYYCCHPYSMIKNLQKFWTNRKFKIIEKSQKSIKNIDLNELQTNCLKEYYIKNNKPILLWGVTGSGKTEIAIQIAIDAINNNQQVLILVPEIALTTNLIDRFQRYFNIEICIWNSQSQNKTKFQSIIQNKSKLIIGARSAVLLPYANLGLIIIDEEHDKSYKQKSDIHYCAINTAVLRHKIDNNIKIFLMSATPSISSLYHTMIGNYNLIKLDSKFHDNKSKITTIYTPNNILLNSYSKNRIDEELAKGRQVMIFINRRGFAHTLLCKMCNFVQKCTDCNRNIIYHYDSNINKSVLFCHICNKHYPLNTCVNCGAINNIMIFGYGVEKIASILQKQNEQKDIIEEDIYRKKEYKIGIFDSDYCNNEAKINEFLLKVKNNEINIILGTQMLSKGHDFSNLSLVIIFMYNLCSYDFTMKENLMQNLMQISGRVGRNEFESEVIIQTPLINTQYDLDSLSYEKFLYKELEVRRLWNLSPYTITIYITPHDINNLKHIEDIIKKLAINIYTSKNQTLIVIIERNDLDNILKLIHLEILGKYKFNIEIND